MHGSMFKLILHAKKRAWVLAAFAVILMPMALPIVPKVEFNFQVMYVAILVSQVRKAAF